MAARVSAAVMAAVTLTTSVAYADEPYTGYNYDWWGDPVPSQNGYIVDQIYTGMDMGAGAHIHSGIDLVNDVAVL